MDQQTRAPEKPRERVEKERHRIKKQEDEVTQQSDDSFPASDPPSFFQHVGLYAYRREFLLRLAELPRTPLERLENLEQLRVLESGYAIVVGVVDEPTFGIDTAEDYRAFVSRVRGG